MAEEKHSHRILVKDLQYILESAHWPFHGYLPRKGGMNLFDMVHMNVLQHAVHSKSYASACVAASVQRTHCVAQSFRQGGRVSHHTAAILHLPGETTANTSCRILRIFTRF